MSYSWYLMLNIHSQRHLGVTSIVNAMFHVLFYHSLPCRTQLTLSFCTLLTRSTVDFRQGAPWCGSTHSMEFDILFTSLSAFQYYKCIIVWLWLSLQTLTDSTDKVLGAWQHNQCWESSGRLGCVRHRRSSWTKHYPRYCDWVIVTVVQWFSDTAEHLHRS